VLAPLIHERGGGSAIKIVETTANQRKTDRRQVDNRWREIKLPKEPRLDRVLIGRTHVEEVIAHQGSHMPVNHLLDGALGARSCPPYQRDRAPDGQDYRGCGRPSEKPVSRDRSCRLPRDMCAQTIGCRMILNRSNESAERLTFGDPAPAAGAFGQMIANDPISLGIEFAIDVGVDVAFDSFAGHGTASTIASDFSSASSRSRPRARRDITVPIGTRTTEAIALYDMPSISRRTMTSRKSTGS